MKRILLISLLLYSSIFAGSYEIVPLGDFALENGETLENCEIAVQTWGSPNADSSNIVIFPTWFGGKTEHIGWFIRPGGLVDSTNFYVMALGAFGNGESSSPSTSTSQPAAQFPAVTIRDMVRAQHQLLTRVKKISHVHAFVGGSMGGMQVFEWLVRYPDFMDKAVPYVSTPQLTSYDLLRQRSRVEFIEIGLRNGIAPDSLMGLVSTIQHAATYSPAWFLENIPPDQFEEHWQKTVSSGMRKNPYDHAAQIRAMMAHDISRDYSGDMTAAAAVIQADVFVIVCRQDMTVNPRPALELADQLACQTLILDNIRGHLSIGQELPLVSRAIDEFLKK